MSTDIKYCHPTSNQMNFIWMRHCMKNSTAFLFSEAYRWDSCNVIRNWLHFQVKYENKEDEKILSRNSMEREIISSFGNSVGYSEVRSSKNLGQQQNDNPIEFRKFVCVRCMSMHLVYTFCFDALKEGVEFQLHFFSGPNEWHFAIYTTTDSIQREVKVHWKYLPFLLFVVFVCLRAYVCIFIIRWILIVFGFTLVSSVTTFSLLWFGMNSLVGFFFTTPNIYGK